jgi:hypothetical protein
MNVRLFGLAAAMTMAMGVVACGDDSGGAGGGSGGSSSTGDSTSTGDSSTGTGTTTSSGGEGAGDATSSGTGEGGDPGVGGAGGGTGGEAPSGPCVDECADDAGCDADPPEPGDACGECVQAEADQGTGSDCAVAGALGACCQGDAECMDYVACVLAQETTCGEDFPEGGERARVCVLESCGACGSPE